MTVLENGSEVNHNRTRKGRTRRVIPKQAIMTVATVRKLPRRSQGPKKYPFAKLKAAMRHYINRCPALTSNTKRVGILLVDWYNPGRRKAWCSLATIADELSMARSTVIAAIADLHNSELVFTKSGGFGAVANEYVPNFWLVLNPATGAIIKQANYDFSAGKWRTSAESVTDFQGQNPVTENRSQKNPENRRNSAESMTDFRSPYSDNGMGGAHAAPASPDGTADCATAPWEDDSEILMFAQVEPLARDLGVTPENLVMALAGFDMDNTVARKLTAACRGHDRWMDSLTNPGGVRIEALVYDWSETDDEGYILDPPTVIWLTDETMVVTGELDLTADSVIGFRYRSANGTVH